MTDRPTLPEAIEAARWLATCLFGAADRGEPGHPGWSRAACGRLARDACQRWPWVAPWSETPNTPQPAPHGS